MQRSQEEAMTKPKDAGRYRRQTRLPEGHRMTPEWDALILGGERHEDSNS
jgi:hypothetical protein